MATKDQRAEQRIRAVKRSVSYRSPNIPPYLCNAYALLTESIVPEFLREATRGHPDAFYVYGGRAEAAYNRDLLSADWDLIFNDRLYPGGNIRAFADELLTYANQRLSHVSSALIVVINEDRYNESRQDKGRLILQLVDPYIPYGKTYDIVDIAGCHDIRDDGASKGNYCDQFDKLSMISGIPYVSKRFIEAERDIVERKRGKTAKGSARSFMEIFAQADPAVLDTADDLPEDIMSLINAYENMEDQIDLWLRDSQKFKRTLHRSNAPQAEEIARGIDRLVSSSNQTDQRAGGKTRGKTLKNKFL
jgi:hypothetical protein